MGSNAISFDLGRKDYFVAGAREGMLLKTKRGKAYTEVAEGTEITEKRKARPR